jgi:hypothetical protein
MPRREPIVLGDRLPERTGERFRSKRPRAPRRTSARAFLGHERHLPEHLSCIEEVENHHPAVLGEAQGLHPSTEQEVEPRASPSP